MGPFSTLLSSVERSHPRTALRYALVLCVPLFALLGVSLYLWHKTEVREIEVRFEESEMGTAQLGRDRFIAALWPALSDAAFISRLPLMKAYLEDTPRSREMLEAGFQVLQEEKGIYDQIRLIDETGRERIRVQSSPSGPVVVPQSALQDKSKRGYVREALHLNPDQIYISRIDLNIERGQVEVPFKPMLRVATPVFDQVGARRGVVVLNVLGEWLLRRLRHTEHDHLLLVEFDGHWLLSDDPEDAWGMSIPERAERGLNTQHPEVWTQIETFSGEGQFWSGGALYTVIRIGAESIQRTHIDPLDYEAWTSSEEPVGWYLVLRVDSSEVDAALAPAESRILGMGAVLALLCLTLSWVGGVFWSHRRAAEAAVVEREKLFRGLLDSAPDATLVVDAAGTIVLCNEQVQPVLGYERDALVGQPITQLLSEVLWATCRDSDAFQNDAGAYPMCHRRDGSTFPAHLSTKHFRRGGEDFVICSIQDETSVVERTRLVERLNAQLESQNHQLVGLNKELESFSYSVAHDLRSPLRSISGFSEALLEDYPEALDEEGQMYLEFIGEASAKMSELIDGLLMLSRMARADLVKEEVDVSALAGEEIEELRRLHPEAEVEVEIEPGLVVQGDPRLLRNVIGNLVRNAWKFSRNSTPPRIHVGRVDDTETVTFFVRDNGVGFDMKYVDKLFGVFQRLHSQTDFEGTGIGLATVQRIITRHGGRVWPESVQGEGATFFISLPSGDLA